MKRNLIIFVILSLVLSFSGPARADRRGYIKTVVIDPGHGGRDPGAVGRNAKEKDITLAISLKLGQYINEYMPEVKVIYTREKDEFVELHRRARIANENHADLFISIHCNSSRSTAAYGTETFVMGLHRSDANLEVARKENASILYEDDYMESYDGFDPHSPEANIIFSLYQNAYLKQSLSVATYVQDQFRERAMRTDRGVKQAGFLVLYQITMPGILVEAGFLSNSKEEKYLMSETGQAHIASAIFRAFRDYKQQQDALASALNQHPINQTKADESDRQPTEIQQQPLPEITSNILSAPTIEDQDGDNEKEAPTQPQLPSVIFRVQIAVSSQKKPLTAPEFKGVNDLGYYYHQGLYKYTAGNVRSLEEAAELQLEMQQAGFKDAFVVAFSNNERITPEEAIKLISLQSPNP